MYNADSRSVQSVGVLEAKCIELFKGMTGISIINFGIGTLTKTSVLLGGNELNAASSYTTLLYSVSDKILVCFVLLYLYTYIAM